jgi:1-acyl-sn-glycerol-3-phosphate acyltransferase
MYLMEDPNDVVGHHDPNEPHFGYGGEHHAFSLIDRLGERVDQHLVGDLLQRDPDYVARLLPILDTALRYFSPEVEGFEHLPSRGPFLVVGNHSGGIYMPDYWAFLRHWFHERGVDDPIYSLGFDFLYSIPGIGRFARRFGSVPASAENAALLLQTGAAVLVYPGGDEDDYRPWTERNRVDLHGRMGFVKLALRHQVPVIPMVAHGSHDVIMVLTRGEGLARRLGFDRLRIKVMPIVVGPPWGIAPVQLPTWPLPAKVTVRVCEPIDWTHHGSGAGDDPEVVRHCYEEIVGRMQVNLDEMVAALPHPVLTRVGSALGLDRLRR